MRSLVGVVAAGVLVAVLAIPAAAAPIPQHCAAQLVPIGAADADGVVPTRLEELGCYATLAEAVAAGSGGNIRLPQSATPSKLTESVLEDATLNPNADVMIGMEWDSTNYAGIASRLFTAPTTCAGTSYEVDWVGTVWNDRFSSGKGFGGCDNNRKFEDLNLGGSSTLCTPNCTNYGPLSNEVSSLRWSP